MICQKYITYIVSHHKDISTIRNVCHDIRNVEQDSSSAVSNKGGGYLMSTKMNDSTMKKEKKHFYRFRMFCKNQVQNLIVKNILNY